MRPQRNRYRNHLGQITWLDASLRCKFASAPATSIRDMKSYQERRQPPSDFVVSYFLYATEDGGRAHTYQHLRCDFMYAGDDPAKDGIYMIHPEFLDGADTPLSEDVFVPLSGRASMWILNPNMRDFHRSRVQVGTRGHFMEGARKIGDLEVKAIVGLHENPTR